MEAPKRHLNVYHLQWQAAIEMLDRKIAAGIDVEVSTKRRAGLVKQLQHKMTFS